MNVLKIVIAILIFCIIIIFHELGHFILAKKNDVKVNEFSLGLGPTILTLNKKGETKVTLKLLPFGGACSMEGEDEESDNPRAFGAKKPWQRFLIVLAGPAFNFIMAWVFSVIILAGMGIDKPIIAEVNPGSVAEEAGLMPGDRITKLGGEYINFTREASLYYYYEKDKPTVITYVRDGKTYETEPVSAKLNTETNKYQLGMNYLYDKDSKSVRIKYPFYEVLGYSFLEMRYWVKSTLQGLSKLITGQVSFNNMSGPVGIVKVIGDTYSSSVSSGAFVTIMNMLYIGVLLSANLGVMNLLPIPALDGGRLIFIIIEWITKKKIPSNKEGLIHFIGIILLFILMGLVMFNDIRKLIMGI